jgi:HAD superfamily hydrolase (TIGR01493 family)
MTDTTGSDALEPRLLPFAGARALIFDCDGTLADTGLLHFRAFEAAMAADGFAVDLGWYGARVGLSRRHLLDAYEAAFGATLDRTAITRRSVDGYVAAIADLEEIAVVAAIARAYRGRLPMAVASGGEASVLRASLGATGLASLFDAVVSIDDVGAGKPDPALFLEAARRLGVSPAECQVYEDSDEGLEAARRAGIPAHDIRPFHTPAWQRL